MAAACRVTAVPGFLEGFLEGTRLGYLPGLMEGTKVTLVGRIVGFAVDRVVGLPCSCRNAPNASIPVAERYSSVVKWANLVTPHSKSRLDSTEAT